MRHTTILCAALALAGCGNQKNDMERQIDRLYDRMPQEERIAQLRSTYMDALFDGDGNLDTAKCAELIPYGIGHFSQYASQKSMGAEELRDRVAELARLAETDGAEVVMTLTQRLDAPVPKTFIGKGKVPANIPRLPV